MTHNVYDIDGDININNELVGPNIEDQVNELASQSIPIDENQLIGLELDEEVNAPDRVVIADNDNVARRN